MKVTNNFSAVITLGSFNPAILTSEFIESNGIYKFTTRPECKTSPVLSQLKSGNISMVVELERLQVMHKQASDFKDASIVNIVSNYLHILQYTPVFVEGVNFNASLSDYAGHAIERVFENPLKELPPCLQPSSEYLFDVQTRLMAETAEIRLVNVKYSVDEGVSISVNLSKVEDAVVLNYNYEVSVNQKPSRLEIIPKNYQTIYEGFLEFTQKLQQ